MQPGLSWRHHHVENARTMGYMPRKTANSEWNQPKRKKSVAVNKAEWNPKIILASDMEMQFGVGPTGFQSNFGPIFPHYVPFPYILK